MKKHPPFRRGGDKTVEVHFIFQGPGSCNGNTTRIRSAQVDCRSTTYERLKQMACFLLGINGAVCLWLLDGESPRAINLKDQDLIFTLVTHDSTFLVEQIRAFPEFLDAQSACLVGDDIPRATPVSSLSSDGHTSDEQLACLLSSELNGDTANGDLVYATPPRTPPSSPGDILVQGSCSQFSVEGGRSACTAICLYAAASLLPGIDTAAKLVPITSELLDGMIQVGVILYQDLSLQQEHTSVDDLWHQAAFAEVVSPVCRGAPTNGMISFEAFQGALKAAMEYASSELKNSVALVVTKPPQTILLLCKDVGSGGPWLFLDSHGQDFEAEKRAYVKQFHSLGSAAAALLAKFPPVLGLGESLEAQHLNMFEAHPIVYKGQQYPRPPETSAAATEVARRAATDGELDFSSVRPMPPPQNSTASQYEQSKTITTQDPYTMFPHERERYEGLFPLYSLKGDGFVYKKEAIELFSKSGLGQDQLRAIWSMVDRPVDNRLDRVEFSIAVHLIVCVSRKSLPMPSVLPCALQVDKQQRQKLKSPTRTADDPYDMLPCEQTRYEAHFPQYAIKGFVYGREAVELFSKSGLRQDQLRDIWTMVDQPVDNRLDKVEFVMAMHLIACISRKNLPMPDTLPYSLRLLRQEAQPTLPPPAAASSGFGVTPPSPGMTQSSSPLHPRHQGAISSNGRDKGMPRMTSVVSVGGFPRSQPDGFASQPPSLGEACKVFGACPQQSVGSSLPSLEPTAPRFAPAPEKVNVTEPTSSTKSGSQIGAPPSVPAPPPLQANISSGMFETQQFSDQLQNTTSTGSSPPDGLDQLSLATPSAAPAAAPPTPMLDPDHFQDPVTGDVFADPVFCDRGHTHERSCIERWFCSRTEEKAKEEERERARGNADDSVQCNRQSNYELTCPFTGEAISDILIENQHCERMVVDYVESGVIRLDVTELEDWKTRRAEKAKLAAEKRAEQQAQRESSPPADERESPPMDKDTVRIERPIEGTLSEGPVDLGLAVALCPSSWQRADSSPPSRCSNPCCSTSLNASSQAPCARCNQIYCTECLCFQVTEAIDRGHSSDSHLVCPDCVWQITDVLASDRSQATLVNDLDSSMVNFFQCVAERNAHKQQQICHHQKHVEHSQVCQVLNSEIRSLRCNKGALENEIREAREKAEQSRMDKGGGSTMAAAISTTRENELVSQCTAIQREHDELEAKGPSSEDDFEYMLRLSELQSRFQALSTELVQVRDSGTTGDSCTSSPPASENELMAQSVAIQKEHDELEARGPSGEDDLEYALRLNELQSQFQALTTEIIQLRETEDNEFDETNDNASSTPSANTKIRGSSKRGIVKGSIRFLVRVVSGGGKKAPSTAGTHPVVPAAETSNLADERVVDDSTAANLTADLAAIAQDVVGNPELPLGLSYPSARMRNQLLLMRNELERRRLESERDLDDHYAQHRHVLESERDGLEDEIASARREAEDAQAAAAQEERLAQERARRRQEVEQERLRKERERAEEKRHILEEKERLERVRRQQEEQTRASLRGKDLRQCGGCGYGPFERDGCLDMKAHNDTIYVLDSSGRRRRRGRNECPECGWTNSDWRNWPIYRS